MFEKYQQERPCVNGLCDADRSCGPVRLRKATAADAPEVAQVWHSAWWDGHRGQVSAELTQHRTDAYFRHQAAVWTASTTLAVDPANEIVGVVMVERDELVQLAVGEAARRLGVGAALLQAAESEIAGAYDEGWLAVVPGNTRARRFYEKHGWRDEGPCTHVVLGGPDGITVHTHRYAKAVASPQ